MALPHFEVPAGAIDGVNVVFTVSVPYRPGSTAVFLNGLLLRADYTDGWLESDPVLGEVTLKEPPRVTKITPDVVQIFYLDTSPTVLEAVIIERLHGRLHVLDDLAGRLAALETLRASLDVLGALAGRLEPEPSLHGLVDDVDVLHGKLECVCEG